MLTEATDTFEGSDGIVLHYRARRPGGDPARAALVFLHGLGDHSGLYPRAAEHFRARGFAWYAPDLRGHGRSPGPRGHVHRWADVREDLRLFLTLVRHLEAGTPVLLLGNSLGALAALDVALHHPKGLAGVVASSPPLGRLGSPSWLLLAGRLLSPLWPTFSWRTGLDLSNLSRDPAVIAGALADPLFHRQATARLATEVLATARQVRLAAAELSVPVLVLHGGKDRIVSPAGSRAFHARLATPGSELKVYPEMYHDLLHDPDVHLVLADIERWIDRRLS